MRRGSEARQRGDRGADALLVSLASRRLEEAGFQVPSADLPPERDMAFYAAVGGYGRYKALRRELVSFLSALDHRRRRLRDEVGDDT